MKTNMVLKSIHYKKTVARILFLSKLCYVLSIQFKTKSTTILKETRFVQLSSYNEQTLTAYFYPVINFLVLKLQCTEIQNSILLAETLAIAGR